MSEFRWLFGAIRDYEGRSLYDDLLLPWLHAHADCVNWLRSFARRSGSPIPVASNEDLWDLYALSRVNDRLLLPHQPDRRGWPAPVLSIAEYTAFMTTLGLRVVRVATFSAFLHEIVEVEQSDEIDREIGLLVEFWPALMLGPMLFSRAGVAVVGGMRHVSKTVAENSTLYWAYARRNRPCSDLSHGWGSNSQWRTSFRRDYEIEGRAYLNVDAEPPRSGLPRGLTDDERMELLQHRCFITTTKPHNDLWPYDEKAEASSGP